MQQSQSPKRRARRAGSAIAVMLLLAGCAHRATAVQEPVLPSPAVAAEQAAAPAQSLSGPGPAPIVSFGANSAPAPNRPAADGDLLINLENADIREAASVILKTALGLDYSVDPGVEGRVTLRTEAGMTRDQVLLAFENALAPSGARLVAGEGSLRIVPLAEAGAGAGGAPAAPGFGVEAIALSHISAENARALVQPMLPDDVQLQADPAGNALIVRGSGPERAAAREFVRIFDVDWMGSASFALEPLRSARAATVATELERIFAPALTEGGPLTIIPVERLNALLVIARQASVIDNVRAWIRRLDSGSVAGGRELHLYYVQNGKARDLARLLAAILDLEASDPGGAESASSIAAAPRPFQSGGNAISAGVGSAGAAGGADPVITFTPAAQAAAGIPAYGNAQMRILADVERNALLILAGADDFKLVDSMLRTLDETVVQVMIEATIAEVALTDELRYGVQWFFKSGDHSATLSSFESGAVAEIFPGFSYSLAGIDARAVLDALDTLTDVTVVSSPQILVLNNQTATLQIGDDVPVLSRSSQSIDDPDAPVINTIEFRRTGVILTVTPRISSNGLVMIDIDQEVSDVVPTTSSGIDSPTIQQRRIASSVAVPDGQTIALGGLIRDRRSLDRGGLPLLSDIPALGLLFSSTRRLSDRSELIVMLTPRVVRGTDDLRRSTEELRRRMGAAADAHAGR